MYSPIPKPIEIIGLQRSLGEPKGSVGTAWRGQDHRRKGYIIWRELWTWTQVGVAGGSIGIFPSIPEPSANDSLWLNLPEMQKEERRVG